MLVVDLFSGTGGASQAFQDRGHRVIRIDNNPKLKPDIVADVRHLPLRGLEPDFVWASPPCTEFSRRDQRGLFPDEPHPDEGLQLVAAANDAIAHLNPPWWVIENVRGARPYLGRPVKKVGSFYLWGRFPPFDAKVPSKSMAAFGRTRNDQGNYIGGGKGRAHKLAKVPYALSLALCMALERDLA